jgi:hypothetical protein
MKQSDDAQSSTQSSDIVVLCESLYQNQKVVVSGSLADSADKLKVF